MTKQSLKGKTFPATRELTGRLAIEDIPAMRKNLAEQVKNTPGAVMTETATEFGFNNGQFIIKPKAYKKTEGLLKFGATFARFNNCRIEYKDLVITATGIKTDFAQYTFAL